jgi:hypothetical protein
MIIESRERTATASDTVNEATASDTVNEATASDTVNEATASDSGSGSGSGTVRVSNLYLIDLAGSERLAYSGSTGMRQKEGAWVAVARWQWLDEWLWLGWRWLWVVAVWLCGCLAVWRWRWFLNGGDWSSIERDRGCWVLEGGSVAVAVAGSVAVA